MFYHAYDAFEQMAAPFRRLAQEGAHYLAQPWLGMGDSGWPAVLAVMAQSRLTHNRPEFGIDRVMVGNSEVAVREEVVLHRPFCKLLHLPRMPLYPSPGC